MRKLFLVGAFFMGLSYIFSQSAIVMKDVGDFTALRVFDKIPVELIPSSKNKVEVTGAKRDDVQPVRYAAVSQAIQAGVSSLDRNYRRIVRDPRISR